MTYPQFLNNCSNAIIINQIKMDALLGIGIFVRDVVDAKDDIKKLLERLTILLSRF